MNIQTVTTSYSRKINHDVYGGMPYESSDHFASLSAEVDEDENVVDVHRQLFTACKELVGSSVGDEIIKMQGGKNWKAFIALLREFRLGKLVLTDSEYQSWNRDQKDIYEEFKKLSRT